MMKALVVDDERIIRLGIQTAVPWELLGIEEIHMAASGKEALKIVQKEQPDIIITDIEMSEMTGLELIAKIRAIRENVRIIVLTGYDKFDYARECLRMQVQDFLLKPVDENVLIETIKKQVQIIKDTREREEEQNHMRRISGTYDQMDLERKMRKLVSQEEVEDTVTSICEKYHYDARCRMRVAILIPSIYPHGIRKGEGESLSVLTIKNLLIGYLDAQRKGITFEDAKGRILVGLFEGEKSDELEGCVKIFTKLIQEECNIQLRIVMGSTVEGFAQVHLSYNDAVYLLKKEKNRYETYVKHKEKKGRLDMFREVYAEFISKMNENIGNTERIMRIFESFCAATNAYNITDQYVSKCCFEIASTVYFSYVVEAGDCTDGKLNALLPTLLSADREENYEITRSFLENLMKVEDDEANELVVKVKRYINEHLTDDISVAGIAGYFYLSPNYFSRLFKRIMNEGCNEYIVRKRIEKAEYLLTKTNMKIGKIAQEVGYRDTNYFSLAFKKQAGMSPGQYREKIRLRDNYKR